jgi:hypothetical protein
MIIFGSNHDMSLHFTFRMCTKHVKGPCDIWFIMVPRQPPYMVIGYRFLIDTR